MNYLSLLPFSYQWILKRAIGTEVNTVLDLGCGDGFLMGYICDGKDWDITGVDVHEKSLRAAREKNIYQNLHKKSITKLERMKAKSYDVVFCSQVIEHLEKQDALKSLNNWERLAKCGIVVTTTVGHIDYSPIESTYQINEEQTHLSGWEPNFFRKRGYVVRGQGAKMVYGEKGIARRYPQLMLLWNIMGYVLAPLVYLNPRFATYMICWKSL